MIAKALIPPHEADRNAVYRWRVSLALVVGLLIMSFTAHIALACGFIPTIFSGFAQAADLTTLQTQTYQIEKAQLDSKILETRTRQCTAIKAGNTMALQFAEERIQPLLDRYQKLNGNVPYRLPGCEELGA